MISKTSLGRLSTILAIYACFYYPIGAFFILYFGFPSTPVNIVLRGFVSLFSLGLIFIFFLNDKLVLKLNPVLWLLLLWWFFYGSRILYDLANGIKFASYGNEFVYGITFGNILLPLAAIVLWRPYFDQKLFIKWSYFTIAVGSVLILISLLNKSDWSGLSLFNSRLELVNDKDGVGENTVLNAILIGFYGELIFLLSLLKLFYTKTFKNKVIIIFLLFVGIILLFLGASRGPFIVCFLLSFILLISRIYIAKNKVIKILKYMFVVLASFLVLKLTILRRVSIDDFVMFRRISLFLEERRANEQDDRSVIISSAWNDFKDSPILGKQFVGTLDGYYPHNIIVEVFMATGIIGSLFFFPLLYKTSLKAFQYIHKINFNTVYVALLFFPCMLFLMTSGSLFQGVEFWIMMTVLLIWDGEKKVYV